MCHVDMAQNAAILANMKLVWNIWFMAPRIKLIVIFNLLWSKFVETNATFRSASTDLDHALVVCIYTQILPPVSGSSHRQPMRDQDL